MTEPVRSAVVGLGYWGPNLVRILHELSAATVEVACDLRPEALDQIRRRYPGIRTTSEFTEILDDDSIEAVVIATPVATHAKLARAALDAGKHVFVEKPLAASSADAVALADQAAAADLCLMPGHTFVYSPPVNLIRRLIKSGGLGEIYFISTSRVNLGIHQADASVVWDLGPHDFSILLYWLDEFPETVSAFSRSCIIPGTADVAFVNLQFPSGTIAHVEMSWLAPSKLRRTAIVGSEKMIVYDDTSTEPVRIFDSGVMPRDPETYGEYRLTYRTGDIVSPPVDAAEPLAVELADFCGAIRDGRSPRSSAMLGIDVVRLIEGVESSLSEAGAPVAMSQTAARR